MSDTRRCGRNIPFSASPNICYELTTHQTSAERLTVTNSARNFSFIDRLLIEAERALATSMGAAQVAHRSNPAQSPSDHLDDAQRKHSAGLMRVNHTGEVCAQALYFGQAAVARDSVTKAALLHAASEEGDHLAWCAERLSELESRASLLNPLWYAGSYAMGLAAGMAGDGYNLGFVVETERQVEAHLGEHLHSLPIADQRSREIVSQMQADEAAHGQAALVAGARELPAPVPSLMRLASAVMKAVAYRV
ncbi:MAG: 2-polyprenyl-3-methyl-6-methoxy-1,4-benzoquinone monooxygenase [Pseudomarimonas sp.]